jgi:carbon-monoxide dehydrogenase large subunit
MTTSSYKDVNFSRQEDLELITGAGKYTADYYYPGMLHMHVIRSAYPNAKITKIDLSRVLEAPGVKWVMTSKEIEQYGGKDIPNALAVMTRSKEPQKVVKMPVLARDWVHFVGQPIAFVIAESALLAQDAAELADIEFEPFPAVPDMATALAPGAPQIHPSVPGNLSADFESGDQAKVSEAFAKAAFISKLKIKSQRLVGHPMEPRAVVAKYDQENDRYRIHTPTQGILGMQNYLTQTTGIPADKLDVDIKNVGGSFGLRTGAYSEHVGVLIASKVLGHPIKWVGTRSEVFLSDWQGRALTLEGSIALDESGKILAIQFHDQVDLGAYNAYMSTFIGTRNLSITMGGVYDVPALYMRSDLVFTNTVPTSSYRGAGRPDIAYAIERLVDFAAREHHFDPIELRRKNFIKPEAFPYKTAIGTNYDFCDFEQVLSRALELSEYDSFPARRAQSKSKGLLRGIGLSTYLEASGAGTAQKDQVEGKFSAQALLTIYGVTGASGQGHATSFAQIVQNELGLPTSSVDYLASIPGKVLVGNGTGGSRTLYGAGSAIKDLCSKLRALIKTVHAQKTHCSEDAIAFANGLWSLPMPLAGAEPTKREFTTLELLRTFSAQELSALTAVGEASSGATFPNGCHVAEVEINPATGESTVARYLAVDELGRIISPHLVRGQVHGGVVQGLGQAFLEEVVYDEQAQLITGSFMDYAMPRADSMMNLTNETVELGTSLNLLGSKGVGESGCTGSLPALANAVMDALSPYGIDQMDMPFTPLKVWTAINAASGKH